MTRARLLAPFVSVAALVAVAGCSNPPAPTLPPSGITSSNGGGQRATGGVLDTTVSGGNARIAPAPSNPTTPRF